MVKHEIKNNNSNSFVHRQPWNKISDLSWLRKLFDLQKITYQIRTGSQNKVGSFYNNLMSQLLISTLPIN